MNRRQALKMLGVLTVGALTPEALEKALPVKEVYSLDDVKIIWTELTRSDTVVMGVMSITIPVDLWRAQK